MHLNLIKYIINKNYILFIFSLLFLIISCKKKEKEEHYVNISASKNDISPGDTVIFNCYFDHYEYGSIRSFTWNFEGGINIHGGNPPPAYVVYDSIGEFDVSITVITESYLNLSKTEINYIKVH